MNKTRSSIALVTMALLLLSPTPAVAHITVNPDELPKGEFAKLAFRVPNERDNAGTTKVEVNFPREHPFAFFNVRPVPGWASNVERSPLDKPLQVFGRTINEAVSKITWEGGPVRPGAFEEFEVSVGPLPTDATQLVFKALQTYSNGEVVRWIEERQPGATQDPETPAPVLTLTAPEAPGTGDDAAPLATGPRQDDIDDAKRLAGIAIALASLAIAAAVTAMLRARNGRTSSNPSA